MSTNNKIFISFEYDTLTDVLYASVRSHGYTKNVEEKAGLILQYDSNTNAPVAATIMDFKYYWTKRRKYLIRRLSRFFDVPIKEAELALRNVNEKNA